MIIYGIFFYSREVFSIPYRQINGVSSTTGIFFGGLQIEIEGFNKNPPFLNKLWPQDAVKARRIINGMVTADKQNIDLTKLNLDNMKEQVEEIGVAQAH